MKNLVSETNAHKEIGSREIWLKRMDKFIDYSKASRWRTEKPLELVELNSQNSGAGDMMSSIGMMMAGSVPKQGSYSLFPKAVKSQKRWHELLENNLALASEPLESWMLSIYEGERLTNLDQVVASPYLNIK